MYINDISPSCNSEISSTAKERPRLSKAFSVHLLNITSAFYHDNLCVVHRTRGKRAVIGTQMENFALLKR